MSYVQSKSTDDGGVDVISGYAFTTNNVAGNTLFFVARLGGDKTLTVTDSQGNTGWVEDVHHVHSITGGLLSVWRCANCKVGANSVSVSWDASTVTARYGIAEYNGLLTSGILDGTPAVTDSGNTGSSAPSSGSVTPTTTKTLLFAAMTDEDGAATITAGSGFTLREASGASHRIAFEDKEITATSAQTAAFSLTAADRYNIALLAYKEVGIATTLSSASKIDATMTSGIKLAAGLTAIAAIACNLSTSTNYATAFKSSPSISPNLSTSIQLGTSFNHPTREVSALTNWSTVVLAGTLYNGNGSAVSPYLWTQGPTPPVGTTLYYDATYITIYSDAQTSSSQANATSVVQWFDGAQWWVSEIIYTQGEVSYLPAYAKLTNNLTTAIPLVSINQSNAKITPNLTTIVSLANINSSRSSITAALTSAIKAQTSLASSSSVTSALTTGFVLQTSYASKSALTATFSTALNSSLGITSKLAAAMTTGIAAQTVMASRSGLTATFALPDTSIQAVIGNTSRLANALTTGVQLQTADVSTSAVTNALTTQIKLATASANSTSLVSNLSGAPAVFASVLGSRSALINDLYAYKAVFASFGSQSVMSSSLGTVSSVRTALASISSLDNDIIVVPVELPPSWRCVSLGPTTPDTSNGQALPDKDPEDVLDYAIIMSGEASELDPLKLLTVSIESCSPDESPVTLVIDNALWAMSDPSSGVIDAIVFWLSGGTVGATYVLRIEADDTETLPHTRVMVRRVTITVAKQ